jgi:hypothetical protein
MTPRPGDRIRIVFSDDDRLHPGDEYIVFHVDEFDHAWLQDSPAHLCHVLGDRWELVEEAAA